MESTIDSSVIDEAIDTVEKGNLQQLKAILDQYPTLANLKFSDREDDYKNMSLLFVATNWPGNKPNVYDIVKTLLDYGADPEMRFLERETPLHFISSNGHDHPLIPLLLEKGANVNILGSVVGGGTPLMNAVHFGFPLATKMLIKNGATVHNLPAAAGTGKLELLEKWYRGSGRFSDLAGRTNHDETTSGSTLAQETSYDLAMHAFTCAVINHQYHCADWLLLNGADIDGHRDHFTPAHDVAYRGDLSMAMYLISRGVDLDIKHGRIPAVPFEFAYTHARPLMMNLLIDHTKHISLEQAACCGRLDKVLSIANYGENVRSIFSSMTAQTTAIGKGVHEEVLRGRLEIARYMLQKHPLIATLVLEEKPLEMYMRDAGATPIADLLSEHNSTGA